MRHIIFTCATVIALSACAQPPAPAAVARAAMPDAEPDVTAQVQGILDQAAGGTLAPERLTDNARAALAPAAVQSMAAALRACGATPALELLERSTKGEQRMYVYRAPCAGKPLIVEIDFGKGSRVSRLQVRPQ